MWTEVGIDFYEAKAKRGETAFIYKEGTVWRFEVRSNNNPMDTGFMEELSVWTRRRALVVGDRRLLQHMKNGL